jgi:hypothetical protein
MTPLLTGVFASQISGQLTPPFTPTGSYDFLASYTVPSGGVSSVTFDGIPSTYSHLQIRAIGRGGNADVQTTYTLRFNGDSSSSYSYHRLIGTGSSASSSGGGSSAEIYLYNGLGGTSAGTNIFGTSIWDILDYASTVKNKTVKYLGGIDNNGSGGIGLGSGAWFNTSAVSSIRLATDGGSNITQFSQFSLYGVK